MNETLLIHSTLPTDIQMQLVLDFTWQALDSINQQVQPLVAHNVAKEKQVHLRLVKLIVICLDLTKVFHHHGSIEERLLRVMLLEPLCGMLGEHLEMTAFVEDILHF